MQTVQKQRLNERQFACLILFKLIFLKLLKIFEQLENIC